MALRNSWAEIYEAAQVARARPTPRTAIPPRSRSTWPRADPTDHLASAIAVLMDQENAKDELGHRPAALARLNRALKRETRRAGRTCQAAAVSALFASAVPPMARSGTSSPPAGLACLFHPGRHGQAQADWMQKDCSELGEKFKICDQPALPLTDQFIRPRDGGIIFGR